MEKVLWGESASLPEGTGVKSLELGRLNAVMLDGLEGLNVLVSSVGVQVIGCRFVRIPSWDMTCKGRQEFWGVF